MSRLRFERVRGNKVVSSDSQGDTRWSSESFASVSSCTSDLDITVMRRG